MDLSKAVDGCDESMRMGVSFVWVRKRAGLFTSVEMTSLGERGADWLGRLGRLVRLRTED